MKKIGVLALQGGFSRHIEVLKTCEVEAVPIRYPEEISTIQGIIVPGGESTTIGKLLERNGFLPYLSEVIQSGLPVFGTCAGLILLSDTIQNSSQIRIGGLPITVERNAYGSQVDSFEIDLNVIIDKVNTTVPGIFIRAPRISSVNNTVETLAQVNNSPVLVKYKNILACSFHPELTKSNFLHQYFISLC